MKKETYTRLEKELQEYVFNPTNIGVYIAQGPNFYHKSLEDRVREILAECGAPSVSIHLNYSIQTCNVSIRLHFADGNMGRLDLTLHNTHTKAEP